MERREKNNSQMGEKEIPTWKEQEKFFHRKKATSRQEYVIFCNLARNRKRSYQVTHLVILASKIFINAITESLENQFAVVIKGISD